MALKKILGLRCLVKQAQGFFIINPIALRMGKTLSSAIGLNKILSDQLHVKKFILSSKCCVCFVHFFATANIVQNINKYPV